jgi:hypothetical protein
MSVPVNRCPICGREGDGVEYMGLGPHAKEFEFVVHHGLEGRAPQPWRPKGVHRRNDFCRTAYYRDPAESELSRSVRASPTQRPDWIRIQKHFRP